STTLFRSSMRAGCWVVFFASSADPTNAPRRRRIGFQFGNPAIDRAPRDTRRLLDYIGPSKAVGARFSRHEKSPSSFVENRQHIRVSLSDGLDYVEGANHPWILNPPHKGRESPKCRRTVLPKTRRHSDSPISSSVHRTKRRGRSDRSFDWCAKR